MNKSIMIATTLLIALVGYCGYLSQTQSAEKIQWQIDHNPKFSPNVTWRAPQVPPIAPQDLAKPEGKQFAAAVSAASNALMINGHGIATVASARYAINTDGTFKNW